MIGDRIAGWIIDFVQRADQTEESDEESDSDSVNVESGTDESENDAEVIAVEHEHAGTKESENEQLLEVVEEEDMLPQPLVEDHLPLAEIQPEESVPVGVQSLIRVQRSKRPYVKDNMDTVWTRWQK
jgi:hypothetical protein